MLRYAGGKVDWVANGLPREGSTAEPLLGDVARRDVPTCRLNDHVRDVRRAARAAGWDICVVTTDGGVVLGLLDGKALDSDERATAEDVMNPAPVTVRPYFAIDEMADYVREQHVRRRLVTTSEGRLLGVVRREDLVPPE